MESRHTLLYGYRRPEGSRRRSTLLDRAGCIDDPVVERLDYGYIIRPMWRLFRTTFIRALYGSVFILPPMAIGKWAGLFGARVSFWEAVTWIPSLWPRLFFLCFIVTLAFCEWAERDPSPVTWPAVFVMSLVVGGFDFLIEAFRVSPVAPKNSEHVSSGGPSECDRVFGHGFHPVRVGRLVSGSDRLRMSTEVVEWDRKKAE